MSTVDSKIPKVTATNFQTIQDAFKHNRICLLRVFDKHDKKDVTLICAVNRPESEYELIPLAIMIEEDPYERFEPPE